MLPSLLQFLSPVARQPGSGPFLSLMRRSYSLAWCSRLPPPQQQCLGDEYLKRGHFLNKHTRKSKGNCCPQSVFLNCFRNQADGFVHGGCALVCSFIRGGGWDSPFAQEFWVLGFCACLVSPLSVALMF